MMVIIDRENIKDAVYGIGNLYVNVHQFLRNVSALPKRTVSITVSNVTFGNVDPAPFRHKTLVVRLHNHNIVTVDEGQTLRISNDNVDEPLFLHPLVDTSYRQVRSVLNHIDSIGNIDQSQRIETPIHFGIGIATYERQNQKSPMYLERALQSLKNQRYQRFTVFIVGDNVTNGYANLIRILCHRYQLDFEFYNNTQFNERNVRPPLLGQQLWHVAGACSMNTTITMMEQRNIHHYVHMDDDNVFGEWHLVNLMYGYRYCHADVCFTRAMQSIIYRPELHKIPTDLLIFPNNARPVPFNTCHSSLSFRLDRFSARYNNVFLSHDASLPADALLIQSINMELDQKNLVSVFINLISVYEDMIGEQ